MHGRCLCSVGAGSRQPVDKVVGWPWSGQLHLAVLHQQARGRVLVLVSLHAFMVDQVGNIQQHLSRIHPPAGDLFIQRAEHPVHLGRDRARFGLPLALSAGYLAKVGEILFADPLGSRSGGWQQISTTVVESHFEMHFGLAAKAFEAADKAALILKTPLFHRHSKRTTP